MSDGHPSTDPCSEVLRLARLSPLLPLFVQIKAGAEDLEGLAVVPALSDHSAEHRREGVPGHSQPISLRAVLARLVYQALTDIENHSSDHDEQGRTVGAVRLMRGLSALSAPGLEPTATADGKLLIAVIRAARDPSSVAVARSQAAQGSSAPDSGWFGRSPHAPHPAFGASMGPRMVCPGAQAVERRTGTVHRAVTPAMALMPSSLRSLHFTPYEEGIGILRTSTSGEPALPRS